MKHGEWRCPEGGIRNHEVRDLGNIKIDIDNMRAAGCFAVLMGFSAGAVEAAYSVLAESYTPADFFSKFDFYTVSCAVFESSWVALTEGRDEIQRGDS